LFWLREVFDADGGPFVAKVFGDEAAVAVVGFFFTAEKAGGVQDFGVEVAFDFARGHEVEEAFFVVGPGGWHFAFFVGIEHFLGGGEDGEVEVLDVEDGVEEVGEVVFFGEAGELGGVVEADVDEAFGAGALEVGEKVAGGFLGEAGGEDAGGFAHNRVGWAASSGSWAHSSST
jgi:hypothetical protein